MKDVFQVILADRSVSDLLPALADVEPESISQYAIKLTDEDNRSVVDWLTRSIRRLGVRSTLYAGAIFYIARELDDVFCGNSTLGSLCDETGNSRTQAYRAIQVFEVFNPIFQANSKLIDQFVSESLKILAEDRTSDGARNEAIRQAKNGTRISIRIAKDLQGQFSEKSEDGKEVAQDEAYAADRDGDRSEMLNCESLHTVEQVVRVEAVKGGAQEAELVQGTIINEEVASETASILFAGFGFRLVIEPEMANQSGGELEKIVEGLERFLEELRAQVTTEVSAEIDQP